MQGKIAISKGTAVRGEKRQNNCFIPLRGGAATLFWNCRPNEYIYIWPEKKCKFLISFSKGMTVRGENRQKLQEGFFGPV